MPGFNHGLEDKYNGLVKCMSGGAKTDFWTGQKPRRFAYANCLSFATCSQRVDIYEPEGTRQSPDFLSIHGEDLAAYKLLMIDNRSKFVTTCKCRDAVQKLLERMALDHHHPIICDALASHESSQFQGSLRRLLNLFSPNSKRPCRRPTLMKL